MRRSYIFHSIFESKEHKVFQHGGVYISFELNCGKCRHRDLLFNKYIKRKEVFPLGGLYISIELNRGKCRCRDLLFNKYIKW